MQQTVQTNGQLILRDLPIEQGQQVEVVLLYNPVVKPKHHHLTARQLLQSGLIGLWQDRTDIVDSVEYARQLRAKAQTRPYMGRFNNDSAG